MSTNTSADAVSFWQTWRTKFLLKIRNSFSIGNPAIINLIWQTCVRLELQEIKQINDVIRHDNRTHLIEINSSPAMKDKWLYDTSASITCMPTSKIRSISINKRCTKINSPVRAAKAASVDTLMPDGVYLFPTEWNGNNILQQVSDLKNLSSPLIFGYDAFDNLGIYHMSRSNKFGFQEELDPNEF